MEGGYEAPLAKQITYLGYIIDRVKIWTKKEGQLFFKSANPFFIMAGVTRLELAISGLTGQCVNQLHHTPTNILSYSLNLSGGRSRARTCDPLLVRQMLSQLSYPPIH